MEKRGKAGTWVWLGAGEHVATITARGASVREPLQKAWLPIERQTWGGGQLRGGFPRQEQQLPTRPSAPRLLCQPPRQPLSLDHAGTHNPAARGLQRTLSSSPRRDLHSSPI